MIGKVLNRLGLKTKRKQAKLKRLGFHVSEGIINLWVNDVDYITSECRKEYIDKNDNRKRIALVSCEFYKILQGNRYIVDRYDHLFLRGYKILEDQKTKGREVKFPCKDDPKSYKKPPVPLYFYETVISDELDKYIKEKKKQPKTLWVNPNVRLIIEGIAKNIDIKESVGLSECVVLFT